MLMSYLSWEHWTKRRAHEPGPNRRCRKKDLQVHGISPLIYGNMCIYIYVGYIYVYGLYIYIYVKGGVYIYIYGS